MKKIFIYNLFLFFLTINFTKAEIYKFFEFAPNLGEKFKIIPENQFIQKFVPFNDFLSLIRLWIENTDFPANFNFQLLDNRNNILVNKEVTTPITNFSWSGVIFDIPLDNNFEINSGQEYKFIITTQENSNLKIFSFSLLELIQNIETNLNLPETIKPLIINNQEQEYSFKIALYEGLERLPPVISNLSSKIISQYLAEISFNANEPIRYDIFYSDNLNNATYTYQVNYFETCPNNFRSCSALINIQPERSYYVKLIAYDYWQNSSTAELNFNTFSENNNLDSSNSNSNSNSNSATSSNLFSTSSSLNSFSTSSKKQLKTDIFINKTPDRKSLLKNNQNKKDLDRKRLLNEKNNKNSDSLTNLEKKAINNQKKAEKNNSLLSPQSLLTTKDLKKTEEKNYFKIFILTISSLILLFVIFALIITKIKRKK